jgi:hypothetical protein
MVVGGDDLAAAERPDLQRRQFALLMDPRDKARAPEMGNNVVADLDIGQPHAPSV